MNLVANVRSLLPRSVTNSIKGRLATPWIWTKVLREWSSSDLLVLTYHKVGPVEAGAPITAEEFSQQIDWLMDRCEVMAPANVSAYLSGDYRGSGRPRVLISFDDGHRCLAEVICPILRERGVRAIAFLATEPISEGGFVWTDEIRYRLVAAECDTLTLPFVGQLVLGLPKQRHIVANHIVTELKVRPNDDRRAFLEVLREAVPLTPEVPPMISWQEAAEMEDVFTWGAHTHSHPILSQVAPSVARREILLSREKIREMTGQHTDLFAYPNGSRGDFTETTKRILKDEGFAGAFTTIAGYVSSRSDRFALNRCPTTAHRIDDFAWMTARPSWVA